MDERQPQAEPQLRGRPLAPTKRQREHQHHCHHLGPLENHRRIMILHFLSSYWFIRFRFLRREDTVHENIATIWDVLYSSLLLNKNSFAQVSVEKSHDLRLRKDFFICYRDPAEGSLDIRVWIQSESKAIFLTFVWLKNQKAGHLAV